jgi:hypothetical protein
MATDAASASVLNINSLVLGDPQLLYRTFRHHFP